MSKSNYSAPALEKGLDIIELLAHESTPLTLQQISTGLERSSSEIYRMVEVLVERGYLVRDRGTHRLSLKLFNLGVGQMPSRNLLPIALDAMHDVAHRIRQSIHLSIHDNRQLVVVGTVINPDPVGYGVRLGSHFPFCSDRASARVITAFQPPDIQGRLLQEMQENTSALGLSHTALTKRLKSIVKRGYEESSSDTVVGIVDIAVPVFDQFHPGAIASLTMPYLRSVGKTTSRAEAVLAMREAARNISAKLGAGHWSA